MISMFFGVPGVGKTTLLAAMALKYRDKYKHIYSNVHLKIDGVTYIDDDCIGKYELRDCLILIDEASIFADNRDYKSFNKNGTRLEYFLMHRHHCADIILFTQGYNAVDKKLRTLTVNLYYMQKGWLLGHFFTKYYPISYGIAFPDGERLGEIAEGYSQPPFFVRLFTTKRIFRPKYYPYFDSWAIRELPKLPDKYKPYESEESEKKRGFLHVALKKIKTFRFKNAGTDTEQSLQNSDLPGQPSTSDSSLQSCDDVSGGVDLVRTSQAGESGGLSVSLGENAHSRFSLP